MTTVLFVTSNGTGLGHLTRCMAIARRLPEEVTPIVFTLSKAMPVVRDQGFYAEYFPSSAAAGETAKSWNVRFARRLSMLLEEYEPAVVAFDGAYPYVGLRRALGAHKGSTSVWIRRAMWLPGVEKALRFSSSFDVVLEPGEFASDVDEGPTVELRDEAVTVPPIVFCDDTDLLSRRKAEEEMGLGPKRTRALIQLGEVPARQRDVLMQKCAARILREPDAEVAVLESAISEALVLPEAVVKLSATYPVARLYRAFDFVVSAAGYNSYHELISFQIPAGFFPVPKKTDNQAARVAYAQSVGVGVELGADADGGLEDLLTVSVRRRMTREASKLRFENGAERAADEIGRLALGAGRRPRRVRSRRRSRRLRGGQLRPSARPGLSPQSTASLISLKTVTAEQLSEIEGIGPATAERIVAFRQTRGGLSSIEELSEVKGVGAATMNALRARLRP